MADSKNNICTYCGAQNEDSATVCASCGRPLSSQKTKFCKHCGAQIAEDCVVCPVCGRQVEMLRSEPAPQPQIVINNTNQNQNVNSGFVIAGKRCNKWTAFLLCLFLGMFGAHKFYEGRTGQGLLYLFTFGLLGIGWIIDCIIILFKPNPYFV